MLFFDSNIALSRYSSPNDLEESKFGGIVINNTTHDLIIGDNNLLRTIPAGKSSREAGIFDADNVSIMQLTEFEGKTYSRGNIKLCDIAIFTVNSDQNKDIITASPAYKICKLIRHAGWRE